MNTDGRVLRIRNRRKPLLWVLAAVIVAAAVVALVVNPFEQKKDSAALAARLYEQRTPYVGDNSKVGAILNLLEYPAGARLDGFELTTDVRPYRISAGVLLDGSYVPTSPQTLLTWRRCAAIVFSLVDNVEEVSFTLRKALGEEEGHIWDNQTFTLRDVSPVYGDVCSRGATKEGFQSMLAGLPYGWLDCAVERTDANGNPVKTRTAFTDEEWVLINRLFAAYTTAAGRAQGMPSRQGYEVRVDTPDQSGISMRLRVALSEGRVFAQLGDDGAVRALDSALYARLQQLMEASSPPATPAPAATPATEDYRLALLGPGGETISTRSTFTEEEKTAINALIFDALTQTNASDGVDINTLDNSWWLAKRWAGHTDDSNYYLYSLDGKGCVQTELYAGQAAVVQPELFSAVSSLILPTAPSATASAPLSLPDFVYSGDDPILRLVYPTVIEHFQNLRAPGNVLIPAVHVHGSYDEDDRRKVLATVWIEEHTYDHGSMGENYSAGVVPVAITYQQSEDGWTMLDFTEAQDGTHWADSIRAYCTMPSSGKTIPGLADKIRKHYSDYSDLQELIEENKREYCRVHGLPEDAFARK